MQIQQMDVDIPKTNPANRPVDTASQEHAEMTASVRKYGVLQPLLVLATMVLLAGHRRLAAAKAAGLKTVPVIVTDRVLSESEVRLIALTENCQRVDLTGWQLFESCRDLMAINPTWQQLDLVKHIGKSAAFVSKHLSPAKLTDEWRGALKDGRVTITQCAEASSLPPEAQNGRLYHLLSGSAQPKATARKPKAEKVSTVVLPLPTGVTVTVKGAGINSEGLVEVLTALLSAAKQAQKERVDVPALAMMLASKAKVQS